MFRRFLLALIASFLLALAPSTAFAVEDPYDQNDGDGVSTDDPNPEPGQVFGVQVESGDCRVVRLTSTSPRRETEIDGKQTNSRTKPGDTDGTTEYSMAIHVEGEFTLKATCVPTDEVLGVQAIAVGDGDAAGATAANTQQAGMLPDTGADSTTTALTVGGGLLLLAGAATLLLRRRNTDAG